MGRTALGQFMKRAITFLALSLALPVGADWELNMPAGVTDMSQDIYDLHMIIFYICCVIGIAVFGAMIYSIVKHRKSVHPEPATFSHSTKAEIAWTTVPIIILVVMAFPAAKVLVDLEDSSESDLSVQVTGYQWNWHYEYPEEEIAFFSKLDEASNIARQVDSGVDVSQIPHYLRNVDKPMVVPVGKKVRILLTANDVIHAWWVPELGGKKDAVPGFVNTMWFKANEVGTYRGQCAELCGRDHGFMPIVVKVVSESDFNTWVANQTAGVNPSAMVSQPLLVSTSTAQAETAAPATAPESTATSADEDVPTAATEVVAITASAKTTADGKPAAAVTASQNNHDKASLMTLGEEVYQVRCSACHQVDGAGMPPAFPTLIGSELVTGPAEGHIDNVLNGKPGTAMVAFGAMLSDEEIAAVVTYERNALGNNVGDVVMPADVAALRNK